MAKPGNTHGFPARATNFGNIWKAYSAKCDKNISLHSDRELAHWILFLEYNPGVESFNLDPPPRRLGPEHGSPTTILDAEVLCKDGSIEWHEIKCGFFNKELHSSDQVDLQRELAGLAGARYVLFNDSDFEPLSQKIMPLLRVAACLSVGRSYYISPLLKLDSHRYFVEKGYGTLGEFLMALKEYDVELLLYVFCKRYLDSMIEVEFSTALFAKSTKWSLLCP